MISWMQRHKKWLVITIWISTIAFVGAGFVGWGSYNYGKEGGVVAVVGDREVSIEEYQQEYSNMYDQYSRYFGSSFNQEMADKLNLKDAAYKQIIQKNLILAYADSLGIDVTDEDIAKELLKFEAFLKNGKFDKPTYLKVLAQNRTTPVVFEESLKRDILLQKLQSILSVSPSKDEIKNLSKLLFIQDDISIKILKTSSINIKPTQKEIKEYWENNKNNYMSEIMYEIQTSEVKLISSKPDDAAITRHYEKFKSDYRKADGKIKSLKEARKDIIATLDRKHAKKEALKKYLQIKKGKEQLASTKTYKTSSLPFSNENVSKVVSSKVGTLLKPVYENNKYVIVKVVKKIDSKALPYNEVKNKAKADYINVSKANKLNAVAQKQSKTFKGTQIKGVSRESFDKIKGLSTQEAGKFLNELFSSPLKEGYVNLGDKVVLYRVNSSKLGKYNSSKDEAVKATLVQLQDQELMVNLVKRLENTFDVQSSLEGKE